MLNKFATGLPEPDIGKYTPLPYLLEYVWLGETAKVRTILNDPNGRQIFLNEVDPITGMNALHIAVGRDNLEIARLLVEAGIKCIPDNEGRMPSLIAAICGVSDELADYIALVEKADSIAIAMVDATAAEHALSTENPEDKP